MSHKHKTGLASALLIGVCAPLIARADVLAHVLATKRLRCGVYADVPPFSAPDPVSRRLVGMDDDLCAAVAAQLGVQLQLAPLSVDSRIPALQMGRIDILIANLAYTRRRTSEIAFSYSYYVADEALVVRTKDAALTPADFRGQRLSAVSGSTSAEAIRLNGAIVVTYHDVGEAYLALQEHKVRGMVTNNVTAHKLILQVAAAGVHLGLIEQPMALEPIAIGVRKGEPAMLAKTNEILLRLDQQGQIARIWNHWLGPGTSYDMSRTGAVLDITKLEFSPLP